MKKIGIIAGNGRFPLITIQSAKRQSVETVVAAIKGEASDDVISEADIIEKIKLGQLKKMVSFFHKHQIENCLLAGKITKTNLFKGEVFPDLDMIKLINNTPDRKDDTLLDAVCQYLEENKIHVIDSTAYVGDLLVQEGVHSKLQPSQEQIKDIEFGWHLAKESARLDIGQSAVVKNQAVMAIEAIEGTDEAILRGGELGGKDTTVVKVSKPNQDMRFDVPTVGLKTIEMMKKVNAKVLAVEAAKTIILDFPDFIKKVNEAKIVFVGKKES